MTRPQPRPSDAGPSSPRAGFRVWHLWLLAGFVAVAIVNIQDQRRGEPFLVGLAAAGFVLYGALAWAAWRLARRLRPAWKPVPLLTLYLAAMTGLFLVATLLYLRIERAYLFGA